MNELQLKLLEMMSWLHSFITSHNLRYYVYGGTMLGVARHQGFIPWDDDVDIVMPRKDYEILCELLKSPIEHYVIETPKSNAKDYLYTYAKFYDTSTSMTELARINVNRGVYIDIFPLDGLGNTLEEAQKYYKKIDNKNMLHAMRTCAYRKGRKWYKNIAVFLGGIIPNFIINNKKLSREIDELNKRRDFDEYQYFGVNMSTYRSKDIHNQNILGKPTLYKFENIEVYGPENFEAYLTETYGDWRQLPPVDKRHSTHSFINLNMHKSYM